MIIIHSYISIYYIEFFFFLKIGVSVVSLDKALETNHLSARVGDNVEIKCDVTGSPSPPIVWLRNGIDLATLNEDDVSSHEILNIFMISILILP